MTASIPSWVPALFLGLMVLGYRHSRPRTVNPAVPVVFALAMLGFSFYGVTSAFGADAPVLALAVWAAGYAATLVVGTRAVSWRGFALDGDSVRVPGSWVPMALILSVFAAKFALGFAQGIHSPLMHELGFILVMSAVLGALSGGFGARALAVHRFASSAKLA